MLDGLHARANEFHDKDASFAPVKAKLDLLDAGGAGLDMVLAPHLNLTVRGTPRGARRSFPRSTLEARQDNPGCQPGFVLTCPINEQAPCCSPNTPVCCHDPSDTCCPQGYFCTGLTTCCLNGAVGCGESCCPSNIVCCNGTCCPNSSFTCGNVNGVSTCVSPSSTFLPTSSPGTATTGTGQGASGYPNASGTSAPEQNNTPIIAGAVGGGVGAILLIGLAAWFFLRKKKSTTSHKNLPPNTEPVPFPPAAPPMTAVTPPINGNNAPSMHKQNHSWSNSNTGGATPFDPSSLYHGSNGSPPPLPPGAIVLPRNDQPVGPGGYVPPPPEDPVPVTLSPSGTPYFTPPAGAHTSYIGGGAPSQANTSAYAPSRAETTSPDTTTNYSASAPWTSGVTHSAHPNDQYQSTPWTAGVTPSPEQQNPVWAQPITSPSRVAAISPPPMNPMSPPPPPFSPAPPGFGGPPPPGAGGNSEGGRVIPMNAPRDTKARPRNTGGG
ncbi:hypothetical protein M408DRAFT_332945 [Serendipita vermifera MAFF 305830]|uniref:Granulins domain-containing protein n=1 Tax=Serendipita vermifera MAFF 305830 TaxID=933852 RepID=A0A0C3ASW0_SERVB|nr:hypothetical protein M408DRAFT_332945 [Serendipita vermifera MAFF 305830]